jgi:predicted O-methyltransferase YrrM
MPKIRSIPWITTGAVQFLNEFFENKDHPHVLEFGCGASTLWFARRTKHLVTVDHKKKWMNTVKEEIERGGLFEPLASFLRECPYNEVADEYPDKYFDLILVDGRKRVACIESSIRTLKSGGIMMRDNSERKKYNRAFVLMDGWECQEYIQTEPDEESFMYKGWKTSWWIKP